jgi:ubiquinone/menaquinone biosynthesis C-methylase UbiE
MRNPEFETVDCPICKSSKYKRVASTGQFKLPTNVVICETCGFSYLNPRWTKERYDHFYTKEYDSYYRPEVINTSYKYDKYKTAKIITERLKRDGLFTGQEASVIDIGSGMGDTLVYLKESILPEAQYSAIEPSTNCINNLRENNINVITPDVDSNWDKGREQSFDLVIMRHVLEHFLDPIGVLEKVSRVLKKDGVVYIAVPNAMKPVPPLLNYYFRVVHVSYFSTHSLSNMFRLSGLAPVILQEGDASDDKEIFAVCKPAGRKEIILSTQEFGKQEKAYKRLLWQEPYYNLKRKAWTILNKFRS